MTLLPSRVILVYMAIRMKEWGLLAYPRQGAHLSLNGLNDWGRTGRVLGQGVEQAGRGAAALAESLYQVQYAGDEAQITGRLEQIGRETAEELQHLPVRDWNYSWQQAYAPRVQQLMQEFGSSSHEQIRRLSEVYGTRFSLEAQRNRELERLRESRRVWQEQLDSAVQKGDADSATRWLEQGKGIFVPESEMPQHLDQVRSGSLRARWMHQLEQEPYSTLESWSSGQEARPAGEEDLKAVEAEVEKTRGRVFSDLVQSLVAKVEAGEEPDLAEIESAERSGVLADGAAASLQQPRVPMQAAESCDWLRRIDERAEQADDELMMEIALAPLPAEERKMLLSRLKATAALPFRQRVEMSRRLWNLYNGGHFGCPGDEEALLTLGRLQQESLTRQCSAPEKECSQWLTRLRESTENWLCYQPE